MVGIYPEGVDEDVAAVHHVDEEGEDQRGREEGHRWLEEDMDLQHVREGVRSEGKHELRKDRTLQFVPMLAHVSANFVSSLSGYIA